MIFSLFWGTCQLNAQDCSSVDNDFHGICSPTNLEEVVAGEDLHITWQLKKAWNRDKIVLEIAYSTLDPNDPNNTIAQNEVIEEKENWIWGKTPEHTSWPIPCDAVGAIVITMKTYNKWFFGALYDHKETYVVSVLTRLAYYGSQSAQVVCKTGMVTLEANPRYAGVVPSWYEGVGTTGKFLGKGMKISVSLPSVGNYAFTHMYEPSATQDCGRTISFPAIQTVTVMDSIPLLMEDRFVQDDPSSSWQSACKIANTYHTLGFDLGNFEDELNQALAQNSNAGGFNVAARSNFQTIWTPQSKHKYDGSEIRACAYQQQLDDVYSQEFLQRNNLNISVNYQGPSHIPAFVPNYGANCQLSTRWVKVYRDGPGISSPSDSIIDADGSVLNLDSLVKGSIYGVDTAVESVVQLEPKNFTGPKADWVFSWQGAPGLIQHNSMDATVNVDSIDFDEFNGAAKTFTATYTHLPTGLSGVWQSRLILGKYRPMKVQEPLLNEAGNPELVIYPNPGSDVLMIELPEGSQEVFVYDINGRVVINASVLNSDKIILQTERLIRGFYFIKVLNSNGSVKLEKWIKAN